MTLGKLLSVPEPLLPWGRSAEGKPWREESVQLGWAGGPEVVVSEPGPTGEAPWAPACVVGVGAQPRVAGWGRALEAVFTVYSLTGQNPVGQ